MKSFSNWWRHVSKEDKLVVLEELRELKLNSYNGVFWSYLETALLEEK